MIELKGSDLHFKNNDTSDLCVHGEVFFKVEDSVISTAEDHEWCVSASALRFLRTLYGNHFHGAEQHMIPCCGHFMIASEDKKTVNIIGCPNGIDFDVIHEKGSVIIRSKDGQLGCCLYNEYKSAVLGFAKQIVDFYKSSPKRTPEDDFSRDGFEAFKNEFYTLIK